MAQDPGLNDGPVAFFDMDLTLIRVNSARLWVEHMWRSGELSKRELLRSAVGLLGYKLAVVDMERLASDAVARIAGRDEAETREQVRQWWADTIAPTVCPAMRAVVEDHRAKGHRTVLLTASSPYASEPLVDMLGLDAMISSRFEVEDGKFTGRVESLCYGPTKVTLADAWLRESGGSFETSWFYTDSFTDLPMLERVANPRVVNPDPRLARWAARNGVAVVGPSQA